MSQEKDDFNFGEFVEGNLNEPVKELVLPSGESESSAYPYQTEVQSSYLLVNALLSLMIRKGIIFPHEVQALVSELHLEYMKKKGREL